MQQSQSTFSEVFEEDGYVMPGESALASGVEQVRNAAGAAFFFGESVDEEGPINEVTQLLPRGAIRWALVKRLLFRQNGQRLGLSVEIDSKRCFMPMRHIHEFSAPQHAEKLVGSLLPVIRISEDDEPRPVVSEKLAVAQLGTEFLKTVKKEQELDGVVVRHFGNGSVAVKVHDWCVGLVYKKMVSCNQSVRPFEALPLGAKCKFRVVDVDAAKQRILLDARKATVPWAAIGGLPANAVLQGAVSAVGIRKTDHGNTQYALFVDLPGGMTGRISRKRITVGSNDLTDYLTIGEPVTVQVVGVLKGGVLDLSIAPMLEIAYGELKARQGTPVRVRVRRKTDSGQFVALHQLVDGFLYYVHGYFEEGELVTVVYEDNQVNQELKRFSCAVVNS